VPGAHHEHWPFPDGLIGSIDAGPRITTRPAWQQLQRVFQAGFSLRLRTAQQACKRSDHNTGFHLPACVRSAFVKQHIALAVISRAGGWSKMESCRAFLFPMKADQLFKENAVLLGA
jgi:hypothetical protein